MRFFNDNELKRGEYLLYAEKVRRLTKKTLKNEYLENKHLKAEGWVVDHLLSIKECYENDVPPDMAAHICNLQIVPADYNLAKSYKSSITFSELLEMIIESDN
jgi:hypothetical protein